MSVPVAVRGYRGTERGGEIDISEIDFNFIPEESCYEAVGWGEKKREGWECK